MSGTGHPSHRRRGQPIATLGLILCGWVAMRAALWQPLLALSPIAAAPARMEHQQLLGLPAGRAINLAGRQQARADEVLPEIAPQTAVSPGQTLAPPLLALVPLPLPQPTFTQSPLMPPEAEAPVSTPLAEPPHAGPSRAQMLAGHQLLWMAAVSSLPSPEALTAHSPAH